MDLLAPYLPTDLMGLFKLQTVTLNGGTYAAQRTDLSQLQPPEATLNRPASPIVTPYPQSYFGTVSLYF